MVQECAKRRPTAHAPIASVFVPYDADSDTLAQTVGQGRHLRVICRCGEVAGFDASAWLDRGLSFKRLADFSGQLRCPCGGRLGRFEVWPGSLAQSGLVVRSAASLYD